TEVSGGERFTRAVGRSISRAPANPPRPTRGDPRMIRLLLCTGQSDADLLRATLAAQPAIQVVGAASCGEEAIALAFASTPDVLAVDAASPDAVATVERVRELLPGV